MEIERNPKGVRMYTFQNERKSMHLIVAILMVAHKFPNGRINKQSVPWEPRKPDLEVNSLTLSHQLSWGSPWILMACLTLAENPLSCE